MTKAVFTSLKSITDQNICSFPPAPLAEGSARLRIERFALTSNNVTYAATGFDIGYWKFFPTGEKGQGIVPVWGFAIVTESNSDFVATGDRFYGFFPMATELVIKPAPHGSRAIRDVSDHRVGLPDVYNIYSRAAEKAGPDEAYQALLQPLIATSYLLFDWLEDNQWFGADQIIIGSASSKTGLGLCAFLAQHKNRPYRVVGLTSKANADFVNDLGFCDQVLGYDEVETLDQRSSVYVDMAGNAEVKQKLHKRLSGHLKHSSAVGLSHWDKFSPPENLQGPKPQFFFAPAQIAKRKQDWGKGVIEQKIAEATNLIVIDAERWLTLEKHNGLEAALVPYLELAEGRTNPKIGHIVELTA